jgi:hypothetical protein
MMNYLNTLAENNNIDIIIIQIKRFIFMKKRKKVTEQFILFIIKLFFIDKTDSMYRLYRNKEGALNKLFCYTWVILAIIVRIIWLFVTLIFIYCCSKVISELGDWFLSTEFNHSIR